MANNKIWIILVVIVVIIIMTQEKKGEASFEYPTDDTYVYSKEAALPHNVLELSAERKVDVGKYAYSYIKFNIPDEDMTTVNLRLWFTPVYIAGRSELLLFTSSTDTSWTEGTLTWNNKPPTNGDLNVNFNTPIITPSWGEIDITDWAKAHRGETVTIIITTDVDYFTAKMDSKEASNKPQLEITTDTQNYQDLIQFKNSYLSDGSFSNFITNANQWVA